MPHPLRLSFQTQGARVELGVNDCPFTLDPEGAGMNGAAPLAEWLQPEGNRLTARVTPLSEPGAPVQVEALVVVADSQRPPLAAFTFGLPAGEPFEPFAVSLPFHLEEPPATRLFREAVPVARLGADALADARALGRRLHDAFARRDLAAIAELLAYRAHDLARAFEEEESASAVEFAAGLGRLLGEADDFVLAPLDEPSFEARIVGNGRLVHLSRGGLDLVSVERPRSEGGFSLPAYAAFVSGEWRIVR